MKERMFIEDSKKYIQIEELLLREFSNSMCGGVDIQETPLGTRVVIYTMVPGLVIGTGGEKIKMITERLKDEFGLKNPQVDVQKIRNPDLNPQIVAQNIVAALEKGVNFKKIGNIYVSRVMRAGARGCEIIIAGKLGGEKGRTEKFYAGFVEKSGTREAVLKGACVATPKLGNIGVKVFITLKSSDQVAAEAFEKEKQQEAVAEEIEEEGRNVEQKEEPDEKAETENDDAEEKPGEEQSESNTEPAEETEETGKDNTDKKE